MAKEKIIKSKEDKWVMIRVKHSTRKKLIFLENHMEFKNYDELIKFFLESPDRI